MAARREALVHSALGRRVVSQMMKMGRALEERGAWLCDFVNRSVDRMSGDEAERLRCEVLAWAIGRPDGLRFGRTVQHRGPTGYVSDEYGLPPLDIEGDPSDAVRAHQNYLRGTLWKLFHDGRADFPTHVTHILTRRPDGSITRNGIGEPSNSIRSAVSDLLVSLGPRLRICQALRCGKFFVARRRQVYCSARCSQATRTATYTRAHPDKAAKKKRRQRGRQAERRLGDAQPLPRLPVDEPPTLRRRPTRRRSSPRGRRSEF